MLDPQLDRAALQSLGATVFASTMRPSTFGTEWLFERLPCSAGSDAHAQVRPSFVVPQRRTQGQAQGFTRYRLLGRFAKLADMPKFVLSHQHQAHECAVVAASWRGFCSPLRRSRPLGSCATGGHRMWWTVEATDSVGALTQLPPYVAKRTVADEVREVPIA
jgi:hypothetical protein